MTYELSEKDKANPHAEKLTAAADFDGPVKVSFIPFHHLHNVLRPLMSGFMDILYRRPLPSLKKS